jgi:hypothetical protein
MNTVRRRPAHTTPVRCTVWFGPLVSAKEEREFIDHLVSEHGVAVCCWPRDTARIQHLAEADVPRLLLVRPDARPPTPSIHQTCIDRRATNDELHQALVELASDSR